MKLKSFGCSLIFGTDLHDDGRDGSWATPSGFSWPALLAQHLGYEYHCWARPGAGNLQILDRLLNVLAAPDDSLFVIGWTWVDRFDYVSDRADPWAMTQKEYTKWSTIMPIDDTNEAGFYYKHLHTETRDKLTSLIYIKTALDILLQTNQPFIMTSLDPLIFDEKYNCSPGMKHLQDYIRPYISHFQGKNFVDYSQDRGHPISATMHPLESAHRDVADLVINDLQDYIKGEYNVC